MAVTQDVYVSIRGARVRIHGEASRSRPVIFVDLDSVDLDAARFDHLRNLPPTLLRQRHATVLVRFPDIASAEQSQVEELERLVGDWDLERVAVLSHPVGRPARLKTIRGDEIPADQRALVLSHARAAELEGILEFGRAIWRPSSYHYRLTSGEHCASYIKLGDAIREPRDAELLASWLAPYLQDRVGLVLDTGTLTPVAQAVQILMQSADMSLGTVTTLDQYPRAGVDIDEALDRAADVDGDVLVLLSVSSSGILLSRLASAVHRKAESLRSARVVIMVDKGGPSSQMSAGLEEKPPDGQWPDTIAWTPLPGQEPLAARGTDQPDFCELCRDPLRAPVIPINPFSFDGMLTAQLRQIVPSISDPQANRDLWEAAQRCRGVAAEGKANDALRKYRSDPQRMSLVVRVEGMLNDTSFRSQLCNLIAARKEADGLRGDADLVLVPQHELDADGFEGFWREVRGAFGDDLPEPVGFPAHASFPTELAGRAQEADRVLVFALGTVTGGSLQHALLGVQTARGRSSGYRLEAFVVHARPATYREWETLRNSFGHDGTHPQLHCGWLTVLPARSPLREEQILLKRLGADELPDEASRQFVEDRIELANGSYSGDRIPVLWGSTEQSHLTPDSIYGDLLDVVSTYAAVASAVTAGRRERRTHAAPELRVFDIAAMVRSYYDPLILGSFFRWMLPHETWWGWTPAEGETTIKHMVERADREHRWILVPELLLATAQGKVIRPAADVVLAEATALLSDAPELVQAALRVGIQLARAGSAPDRALSSIQQ